uniref:KIB1-4 beta-propeller domain-containing protein n=1 Tax=Setaria viridis TaxID=4556 RepID=A0A4U6V534_SETVI|nr:hypothetical protein SEVIR_3G035900v2 [Setaria viridis]
MPRQHNVGGDERVGLAVQVEHLTAHGTGARRPDVRRMRFCASANGGWLILVFDSCHGYALYNVNFDQRIPLPASFTTPWDKDIPLVMHADTFSAPPFGRNQYMVAAIVLIGNHSTAAFWSEARRSCNS